MAESPEISDTSSVLSSVDSAQFNNLALDPSFSIPIFVPFTDASESGSYDLHTQLDDYTSRTIFRLSDPASDYILFLGTHEYERSMYELDDTIVVDTSKFTSPVMWRPREQSSRVGKRILQNGKRKDKGKGREEREKDTEPATTTDEEAWESSKKKGGSSSRKRKGAASTDEEYHTEEEDDTVDKVDRCGGNSTTYEDTNGGNMKATRRTSPKKGGTKTRTPVLGQFNVSGASCVVEGVQKIGRKGKEQGVAENTDDSKDQAPEPAAMALSEEEKEEAARVKEVELSLLTDRPPPNWWYAGTPTRNSQWTICVTPSKPTWYHPDWDAARRKQADGFTKQWVKDGKKRILKDIDGGLYRDPETKVLLITRKSIVWWQCHSYRGGQSWAINVQPEGYDEY